jgi:hypothetical protein
MDDAGVVVKASLVMDREGQGAYETDAPMQTARQRK